MRVERLEFATQFLCELVWLDDAAGMKAAFDHRLFEMKDHANSLGAQQLAR
jgi:hypothetical protein